MCHSTQQQQQALHSLKYPIKYVHCVYHQNRALVIPSHAGVALVSLKFAGDVQPLQVGAKVWGYVIELQSKYALVVLPLLTSAPTAVIYLDPSKPLNPLTFMQSVYVRVKKLADKDGIQKIVLEAIDNSEYYNTTLAMQHFNQVKV